MCVCVCVLGRDSPVGIATRCGLDGPGIEFRWGTRFLAPVQTRAGAHPASYTMGTQSFPVIKLPGRGVDHPLPSSAEVKEKVELYFYTPSGRLWPVLGYSLPLYIYIYIYIYTHTHIHTHIHTHTRFLNL